MTYGEGSMIKNARRASARCSFFIVLLFCLAMTSQNAFAQITLPPIGDINTLAGDGTEGYSGNGGLATSAELFLPTGVAVDSSGNIYIADTNNELIRMVSASTGAITNVAGNRSSGYSGDGGLATSATLYAPYGVAIDTAGNIYIADTANNRIRKVTASTGIITTVAGNGTAGYSGDNGAASSAELNTPWGVAVDAAGNIYIADANNNRIREVAAPTGIITTVAGNGTAGYTDNLAATSAELNKPEAVAVDNADNIYIGDVGNNVIRKVTVSTGIINTIAGNGIAGYSGDNGTATSAELHLPSGVAVDAADNIYIADYTNNAIRKVTASTGIITTIAGNSTAGYSGDGGTATSAELDSPFGVAVDTTANIYIGDRLNNRVRAVGVPPLTTGILYPTYEVTSILYAPPGNKSQAGYTDTTTTATTTTVGGSLANASTVTFTEGIMVLGSGGSASQSFGVSKSTSNSSAFQESFSDATGVANQNSSGTDAINHNQDLFLIWLNPQLSVMLEQTTPVSYSVAVQGAVLPDIVPITASVMEANSGSVTTVPIGSTSVPAAWLNQQNFPSGPEPGLAAICKNLIQSEYAAGTCTLADQCGCTPADFAPILALDPLLFQNGTTYPISPFPGTVSPLETNTSTASFSDADCGTLPTPALDKSDCRYVPVPDETGSSLQAVPWLAGLESPNGDNGPDTFQQGENQQTTQTLGGQTQESVGASFKEGSPVFSLTEADTLTWTQSQSVGTANGSGYVQSVTLNSSTLGCGENEAIFEDTVYHTFVFQEFPDPGSTCTQNSPSFSITATNPSQTTPLSLGHSMSYTIEVSPQFGFSGTVMLSASGLPAGVTAQFSPASVPTSGLSTATLTLTSAYSSATYVGSSTLTVTGTSGGVTQSAVVPLTTQPLQYIGYCGVQ